MEVVGLIEGIGESLLHYACLNNSNNMPFFVTFLMENGVDPTIKNKRGAECWEFLTPPKKHALSKYIGSKHYSGAPVDESAIQGYDSFKPDPEMEEEPPVEIEYQEEEEDDQTKLLRELLTIRVNMQSFDAGNPIAERALEAVERALELQRPKGVASSLHKLERKSTEYCEGLLRTKNVMLNNRTSRQMISEGKMMICINQEEQTYQHVYYFLYNDCWVIFDDQQANGEEFQEDDLLRVIPLTHLSTFYIPENQGIPHGIQVVFYPVADTVRSSFTILMPSEKRKMELIEEVQAAFKEITKAYITVPLNEVPDDDQVVHQGYLVMKGIVINFHLRVYVRLTSEFLYYYESETSYTILGKILIKNVTSRFDKKRKMIKWMTKEGRSFCFYALNQTDFVHWTKRMRGEEPTPVLDGLEEPPSNMRVDITIMAGRDILSKDANGYSDPYCIVGLCDSEGRFLKGYTKYKTQTQYKTLKPDWTANNRFVFDPVHEGEVCSLRVDMWDEDKLSSDDFLGHALITPSRFYNKEKEIVDWVALTSRPGRDEKVAGDVCVRVAVAYDE